MKILRGKKTKNIDKLIPGGVVYIRCGTVEQHRETVSYQGRANSQYTPEDRERKLHELVGRKILASLKNLDHNKMLIVGFLKEHSNLSTSGVYTETCSVRIIPVEQRPLSQMPQIRRVT